MTKIILGARWIALGGGLVALFQPVSKLAARAASRAYTAVNSAELADGQTENDRLAAANEAYSCALAREGILAWGQFTGGEGEAITTEKVDCSVVTDAEGNVLQPTPEAIDQFMAIAEIFDAVDEAYVSPYVARVIEKNVSSRLPSGSSVSAGTTTAAPAFN
ncbi:MAG: hypothetical protein NVV72_01050 [Asticcacaulis sp.]|nr:hypothetical protein [Asticcacaulis sp.]